MSHFPRVILVAAVVGALVSPLGGSSHREAPLITEDPVADNTDVYAFVSPDDHGTVTLLTNFIPGQEPSDGPNFFKFGDQVRYHIFIDNDGNAVPDIEYQFDFTTEIQNPNTFLYNTGQISSIDDPDFNIRQSYSVRRIVNGVPTTLGSRLQTPPVNIGPRTRGGSTRSAYQPVAAQAVHTLSDGSKVFAGQRADPFFVDIGAIFDLVGLRPFNPAHRIPLPAEAGVDRLEGFNVHTIALQIPKRLLTKDGSAGTDPGNTNSIIGVYSTATRPRVRILSPTGEPPTASLDRVQVSRLGHPLINEVIIPLAQKDRFNASQPVNDVQFLTFVQNPELASLIAFFYRIDVPPAPRNDLAAIFLAGIPGVNRPQNVVPAEMLRLNMAFPPSSSPNRLGLLAGQRDGFPNGRRLIDDVVDIELRVLAGGTPITPAFNRSPNNVLADGVDQDDKQLLLQFPYVPRPHGGYSHIHTHAGGGG